MAKDSKDLHLIDRWDNTDPGAALKTIQYGKQCSYEVFFSGGLRIAAKSIEKDIKSGYTKYLGAMVIWNGKTFVYDHVLVDQNTAIAFPIDPETVDANIGNKEI